jgi:hypothetical protein
MRCLVLGAMLICPRTKAFASNFRNGYANGRIVPLLAPANADSVLHQSAYDCQEVPSGGRRLDLGINHRLNMLLPEPRLTFLTVLRHKPVDDPALRALRLGTLCLKGCRIEVAQSERGEAARFATQSF